jgi:hypothetical protein
VGITGASLEAFEEAVKQWPDQKLTLRNGIMLMREHPPTKSGG